MTRTHKTEVGGMEVYHDKPKHKMRWSLILLGLFIIFVGCTIIGYIGGTVKQGTCRNEECFINLSNQCMKADLLLDHGFGTIAYHSENCMFQKSIIKITDPDSQELKPLLEGKTMNCTYEKGDFDEDWVYSMTAGIEKCDGELVTNTAKLMILVE